MRWLLSQRWDDLLFAHWPVEAEAMRGLLPAGVEPDIREGRAWIGVVAFRMTQTRAGGLLPPRGLGPIPELNVRTYVRVASEPGVWFLSLDTSSPLFVTVGRAVYGLEYHHARMVVARNGRRIHYASSRGPAAFAASYEPIDRGGPAVAGSLEKWLVERYRLYALRGRRLVTAEVAHPPWTLQAADARIDLNTLAPRGIRFSARPLLHFSPGVDALISVPASLAEAGLVGQPHRQPARAPGARRCGEEAGQLRPARAAPAVVG